MNNGQIAAFSIMHALGALLLPLLIFLLGGCIDPEPVNKPGPAIPCDEIETALNSSVPGPWTFEVGEFMYLQETVAPVNQAPSVVEEVSELVLSVSPQSGYSALRIVQTTDYSDANGQPKRDTVEGTQNAPGSFRLCSATAVETYHNFAVEQSVMPVPMVPASDCDPKFPNCQMNITTLRFDKLVTVESGEVIPVHVQVITSNEVPYLSRVIQFCTTYPLEADGRRIPVTRCSTVKNLRFRGT